MNICHISKHNLTNSPQFLTLKYTLQHFMLSGLMTSLHNFNLGLKYTQILPNKEIIKHLK